MLPQAMYLTDGYSKSRGLSGWYRDVTVGEIKRGFDGALCATNDMWSVREVRRNGSVKTWKRSTGCELPLKHGFKECFRVGSKDLSEQDAIGRAVRIVVRVTCPFPPEANAEIVRDWLIEKGQFPS